MWLMVSYLSPHSQHLLFGCVLSILVLIWLVFIALFCAAIIIVIIILIIIIIIAISCEFFTLMFFLRSLAYSEFPQVSRTLLSILADINNTSLDGLDSSSDFRLFQPLGIISNCSNPWESFPALQLHKISPLPSGSIAFIFLSKFQVFLSLFFFFDFYSVHYFLGSLFLLTVTKSGLMVRISRCVWISKNISLNFMRLILLDGSIVEFQFLAQFPVNHFSHRVVFMSYTPFALVCCIRFLCD